ncbi:Beta (1-6) glucans synthase [Gammaproteobacteria bacterium]
MPNFSHRSTLTVFPVLVLFIVCVLLNFAGWWWFNRPVSLPLSFDEPLTSVSFAPYRRGQNPLTEVYPSPAQIEEDMASLVGVTRGIRTYTSREGLEDVPQLARKYGLILTQGAWLTVPYQLDGTPTFNEPEIAALIRSANTYPDTVRRVIVGNEVLLRGELTPAQLITYLRQVKAAVKQPVTYADVWAFFEKYPEVGRAVDFLTIHILPYWEDEPVSLEQAAEHVVWVYRRMQRLFPGKPILIGEIGWPTQGRTRGPAVPSVTNSARFLRIVARLSQENGFDYNWVEAFDQPWKSALEGTVGANWGVVNEQRRLKFGLDGPVVSNPDWLVQATVAVLLGVVGFLLGKGGGSRWRQDEPRDWRVMALSQFLGSLVIIQAVYVWDISYTTVETSWAGLRIALHLLFAGVILAGMARRSVEWSESVTLLGRRLIILYVVAALFTTALLFVDGRYRDIPTREFLVPGLGVTAYALARVRSEREAWLRAFSLPKLFPGNVRYDPISPGRTTLILLAAMWVGPLSESWALSRGQDFLHLHPSWAERIPLLLYALVANTEMLGWSILLGVMAVPFLAQWRLARRARLNSPAMDSPCRG